MLRASPSQRLADGSAQMVHVLSDEVGQVGVLGSIPQLLIGIEIGGIGWQPFDVQPLGKTLSQTACGRAMHRPAVPHQDNAFGKMFQQRGHKGFGLVGGDIAVEHVKIKTQSTPLRRERNGRNGRQAVTSVPAIVNRRLVFGRPAATDGGLQHKAAFVGENDGFTVSSSFFLYEANPFSARRQWLLRRVRGHGVLVSGNSSPYDRVYATRPTGRSSRRSVCGLSRRFATESIARWDNPVLSDHVRAIAAAASTDGRSAWTEHRDAVWLSRHLGRLAEKLLPTDRPQRALRRNAEPPRTETILDPAASWPAADAAPRCCWKVKLPYKTLSANSSCLSELFKGQ